MMTQTTTQPKLRMKTPLQEEREARDLAIYEEYNVLAANPQQSRVALNEYFMGKYNIRSTGTLYTILKRVRTKLQEGEK